MVHTCNPSYSGSWGRKITWTQEVEVAVSWDRAIALQPGQQELNSVSKIIIIIIIIIIIVRYAIIFSHLQHVLNQASHITSAQWPQHTDLKMSPISLFPKIVLNLTFYLIFGCSKRISNNLTKWWKVIPFNEGMVGQNKEVKERFELALFIEKSSHVSVYSFKTNFYF